MKDIFELTKLRISFLCAFCASAGYIVYAKTFNMNLLVPFAGTLFLACGANAFNQIQEKDIDNRMNRTEDRPLPGRRISITKAFIIALILTLSGSFMLFKGAAGITPGALGVFSLFWYLGVYYFLKKLTAFAAVPGAVVGMIPPIIGWSCAGGGLLNEKILAIAVFFFLWQVPHFWMLILKHPDDYQNIEMPVLTDYFTEIQLSRITFVWTLATVSYALILPLFDLIGNLYLYISLLGAGLITVFRTLRVLMKNPPFKSNLTEAFKGINFLAIYTSAIMIADTLIGY